jgi:hypothetical protein
MNKIKLSAENSYSKHTIELGEDSDIEQMFTSFRALLIGLTFPEVVIDNQILQLAQNIIPDDV